MYREVRGVVEFHLALGKGSTSCKVPHACLALLRENNRTNNRNNAPSPRNTSNCYNTRRTVELQAYMKAATLTVCYHSRLAPSRSFFLCIYSYLNKIALKSSEKDHLSKITFEITRQRSRGIHFCERAREGKQTVRKSSERSSAILFLMPARALRFCIQRSPANLTSNLEQVYISTSSGLAIKNITDNTCEKQI